MKKFKRKEYFLATTALEEFWDISKPIVFLGEWCKRYSRRSFWEPLKGKGISIPLNNIEGLKKAEKYINTIYNKLLPLLTNVLNEIHGTNHSLRYWKIVIGPWFYYYVRVIYDRYIRLQSALKQFPEFSTIVMSEESFITPNETGDFFTLVCDDPYNLQIFTRILKLISNKKYCQKKYIYQTSCINVKLNNIEDIIRFCKNKYRNIVNKIMMIIRRNKTLIMLITSFFPHKTELNFSFRTLFGIRINKIVYRNCPYNPLNIKMRDVLNRLKIDGDEFINILLKLLFLDIPKNYIESYQDTIKQTEKYYPISPKIIFCGTAWYGYDEFKYWAAESNEKGTILLGCQHGGNYGIDEMIQSFVDHELEITDYYYSWGWIDSRYKNKMKALPAAKLIGRKKIGADNKRQGILFGVTSATRYSFIFSPLSGADYFNEYLNWQLRFISSLLPELSSKTTIRAYREDLGWDWRERWKDKIPQVMIENMTSSKFYKRIKYCRIYVCDHFSTTYAEALAVNKPTVLFWNPKIYILSSDAQPYFDKLRSVGILYDSPEEAAKAINNIYDDIENWWNEPCRQKIIHELCEKYVKTSPNAEAEWLKEFQGLLRKVN